MTSEWEPADSRGSAAADASFAGLAAGIVDGLLEADPVQATYLGDHRVDDRLPDLSPSAVEAQLRTLDEALEAVDQVDDLALSPEHAVDLEILRARLSGEHLALGTLAEHTWNPLVANPGTALYLLLARDFAPPDERAGNLAARMLAVPASLQTSRASLGPMPRVHVETAIGQFHGTRSMLGGEVDALLEQVVDPATRRRVDAARATAQAAIDVHVAWLTEQLEADRATRDPRLGPEAYAAKLWATLDAHLTPDDVLRLAEDDLVRIEGEIARAAADYLGERQPPPDDAAAVVRRALDAVAAEAPVDDATVLSLCERELEATTAFVRAHDLVTVHDDEVRIVEMPEIHRGVAVAYCDPPGPLETAELATFFAVAPTPADWSAERVTSFYREYNARMVANLTVHEAMPGHVLQLAHARRAAPPTAVRTALWSGPFVEGWAVYAEELMADHGYDGGLGERGALAIRLQQLKMQLRMTINAILDVRVHAYGLAEADAMRLLQVRGHQEEGEAVGKWRRSLLTSTQLSTYYVGYVAVRELVTDVRRAHPDWNDRRLHDAVLGHGSPPPRHLRVLLGL